MALNHGDHHFKCPLCNNLQEFSAKCNAWAFTCRNVMRLGSRKMPPLMFHRFPQQKSAEPKFVFVTKKKDESTISQMMGIGNYLSVIPVVPVQYMPSVGAWRT